MQQQQQSQQQIPANAHPSEFREYTLYIDSNEKDRQIPGSDQVINNSKQALRMVKHLEQEVWIQDVKLLPPQGRPSWLVGVPTLVHMRSQQGFVGKDVFIRLSELKKTPKGIDPLQGIDDDSLGYSVNPDATVDSLDEFITTDIETVKSSVTTGGRKLKEDDVQSYIQKRQQQEKKWGSGAQLTPAQIREKMKGFAVDAMQTD